MAIRRTKRIIPRLAYQAVATRIDKRRANPCRLVDVGGQSPHLYDSQASLGAIREVVEAVRGRE